MAQLVCDDVFYEVMKWVDGETLATLACVSSNLHSASQEESLWEQLCTNIWPSSKEPGARELIQEIGGFKKLYSESSRTVSTEGNSAASLVSCSSFASLVDVQLCGKSLLSQYVDGIPNSSCKEWFSSCPFRFELAQTVSESKQGVDTDENEIKRGRIWKEINEGMRVSWILINKKTGQLANLSSQVPVSGRRHFPTDRDYVLRFGSIVSDGSKPVECSIVVKCRAEQTSGGIVNISLSELSMQLKHVFGGEHLNGEESLVVLSRAVGMAKSRDKHRNLTEYKRYLKLQNEATVEQLGHLDVSFVLVLVSAALWLLPTWCRCTQ